MTRPESQPALDRLAESSLESTDADIAALARGVLDQRSELAALRAELAACSDRRRAAEGKNAALELESERAHHLLDQVGLARETVSGERMVELSLDGRIQLGLDDDRDG